MILPPRGRGSKRSGAQQRAGAAGRFLAAGNGRRFVRALGTAWPLWVVVAVCVGLQFGGPGLRADLRYDRAPIMGGQWWRLFTGNFVHASWMHIGLDLSGVVLLWVLTGRVLRGWRWLGATVVGAWAIGLGLWWAWPELVWYVGISGVATTYWAAGAVLLVAARSWEGWALLVFLAGKLAWEQASGRGLPTSSALLHEPIVTSAHLVGAIAGIIFGLALVIGEQVRQHRRRGHKMAPDPWLTGHD